MGDTKAKTTLVFHYVAQTGPDPWAESRKEEGVVPLLSSGHIIHVLRQNCQQHSRTTGSDAESHLKRG